MGDLSVRPEHEHPSRVIFSINAEVESVCICLSKYGIVFALQFSAAMILTHLTLQSSHGLNKRQRIPAEAFVGFVSDWNKGPI